MSYNDKRAYRADGGDISTGRLKEIADNPYGDEEKCWLAKRVLASLDVEPIYQCEFCHHDGNGELQWHWEDVNKDFYDQYDSERRGKRRVIYSAPPAPDLPNGWVMVPAEPTSGMLAELCLVEGWTARALNARYQAMLAAVPHKGMKSCT